MLFLLEYIKLKDKILIAKHMMCPVCKKVTRTGGVRKLLRGNYNPTGKRKRHPNLQWAVLPNGKRMKMCTNCKKSGAKDPSYFKKKGVV